MSKRMLTGIISGVFALLLVLISTAFGDNVNIIDITAKSGNEYKDGGIISVGSKVFFDKEVTMLEVPKEIAGAQFVKGWNEDAGWHWNNPQDPLDKIMDDHKNFLKIIVDRAVKLWVLFDRSDENAILNNAVEQWLWDGQEFERTDIVASAKGSRIDFTVYRAKSIYPKGTITLGSLSGQGKTMYVPLVGDADSQSVQSNDKSAVVWGKLKAAQ